MPFKSFSWWRSVPNFSTVPPNKLNCKRWKWMRPLIIRCQEVSVCTYTYKQNIVLRFFHCCILIEKICNDCKSQFSRRAFRNQNFFSVEKYHSMKKIRSLYSQSEAKKKSWFWIIPVNYKNKYKDQNFFVLYTKLL